MSRWTLVLVFAVIAVLGTYFYFEFRVPPGVQPMSKNSVLIEKLSLYSAIAGAAGAFFTMLEKFLGLFKRKEKP